MITLNSDIFDILFTYMESVDCLKLYLTSIKLMNILNDCNYWKSKCVEYYSYSIKFSNQINYIKLYQKLFNSCCFICKDKNYISCNNNYTHSYNICYFCKNSTIHATSIKYEILNQIKQTQHPFYDLDCYIKYMRDKQFHCMISKMNKRKFELEESFSKRGITIPADSKLCRNYILSRITMNCNQITTIICQKKYIYEYTPFLVFKKYYYKYSKSWKKSHQLALKMVLDNNKYPKKFPWETR